MRWLTRKEETTTVTSVIKTPKPAATTKLCGETVWVKLKPKVSSSELSSTSSMSKATKIPVMVPISAAPLL